MFLAFSSCHENYSIWHRMQQADLVMAVSSQGRYGVRVGESCRRGIGAPVYRLVNEAACPAIWGSGSDGWALVYHPLLFRLLRANWTCQPSAVSERTR
jgi:hypothetical protein